MTVVLHDLLGDAVLALPMLRQLAAGFPGCVITVLTGPSAAPLLRAASATSNLHIVEVPAAARGRGARNAAALSKFLRDRDADAILIAYCHNLHPAPLFIQGEAPVVAWPLDNGLDQRLYADLLAARIPKNFQKAEVAALLDLLNPFGIETRLERPSFQPSAEARESISGILAKAGLADRTYAVLHVEPATRAKNWPMERFFEVADFIHDAGVEVVLEGSRASRIASEEARAERPWCHSVQGLLDTDELGALIERSRFFVGCDSGPAHVAQAVGAPALLLFGATEPHRWGPLPQLPSETSLPWQVLRAAPGDWLVEETRGLTVNEGLSLLSAGHVCEVLAGFMKSVENIAPGVERH